MVRDNLVKEYIFDSASLTGDANGLFSVYSDIPVLGAVQNIQWEGTANYTSTGSIIIFSSGIGNSGTGLVGEIMKVSGVSVSSISYPSVIPVNENMITGSVTSDIPRFHHIVNTPLRVVGSAVGANKSGLGLIVRYV